MTLAEILAMRDLELERDEWKRLALDMGEALRAAHDPERWSDFLTMQVDELLLRLDGIANKDKTT